MKATIVTTFTLLILAVVGVVIGPSFVDWSKYKTQAQEQIKSLTGYDAVIGGDLSLALLPLPHVSVEDVTVNVGEDKLASLEKLNVNVEFMPLLSKKIVVQSVDLVKPDITIAVLSNGTQNWQTSQVQALMDKKGTEEVAPKSQGAFADSVSLESVTIEKGRFTYKPGGSKPDLIAENVNADIAAQTLKGPFEVDGSLAYAGKAASINAKIGALEGGAQSVSVKAEGAYAGLNFSYGGVIGVKDPFEAQGEAFVAIDSLADFLNNPSLGSQGAALKGLVTASTEKATIKNAEILAMGNEFTGQVDVTMKPMSVTASLDGKDTVNLDGFLPKKQKGGDITEISNALPKTLSLPAGFEARLNINVPAAIYNGQTYEAVEATIARQAQSLKANVKAKAPGSADINLRSDLSFASKSISQKTGSEILADPSLDIQLKIDAPNVAQTARAITGKPDIPYVSTAKSGSFDFAADVKPGMVKLNPSTVRLDSQSYKLSGSLTGKTVVANIDAFGGQLIVKGDVAPGNQISNMAVQIKHSSLPKALQVLNPDRKPNPWLTGPVDFYTEVQQNGQAYTLSNIKANILNTNMTGDLMYDGGAGKPSISGDITFADLVIPSAGKSPAAKATSSGTSGQWSAQKIDSGFLYNTLANLNIKANSIKYEKWDIVKPSLKFKLGNGALNVSQLDAGLFGGQLSMSADVTAPQAGPLTVKSDAKLTGVQIESLMEALAGNKLVKGKGVVSVDTQILTSGASQAAMISALSGQGAVSGNSIVLEGIDVARFVRALSDESKPGDSLLSLWKGTTQGGSTAFNTLAGNYTITNGIVNITNMDLDGDTAAIATTGTVDLPKWYLKTANKMSVKNRDDIPPFTMNIEGPLNNPGQTFAKGAINDYLSRKLSRKLQKVIGGEGTGSDALDQLLGGVLGGGAGQPAPSNDNVPQDVAPAGGEQDAPAQEEQKSTTPEEALEGVLKGLFE